MRALKENIFGIIFCLAEVLVGVLLLMDPAAFTAGIITGGGIVLIVIGVLCIIRYFRMEVLEATASQSLAKGLIALAAGIFCAVRSQWFVETFPLLTIVYGIVILVTGLAKVQLTVDMLRMKNKKWFFGAIAAAVSIICAVVILMNPFKTTIVLWKFTGIALIVETVFDIIALIVSNFKNKEA